MRSLPAEMAFTAAFCGEPDKGIHENHAGLFHAEFKTHPGTNKLYRRIED